MGDISTPKEKPMEKLARLFGRSIRFAYHCFDRIMIRGYLSALSRPENIVYFFRSNSSAILDRIIRLRPGFRLRSLRLRRDKMAGQAGLT